MTNISSNFFGLSLSMYRSLLLGEVNDFFDEEGRPIGEVRSNTNIKLSVETENVKEL